MPVFAFAAAKDGDLMLASVRADDIDVATDIALTKAGEYHGFDANENPGEHEDGVPHESWFGGFKIEPIFELDQFSDTDPDED
jgi:hypothetical protein